MVTVCLLARATRSVQCAQPCDIATVQTADNGVAPACVDLQCVCSATGYTYYDATADGLNAIQPSGCYPSSGPTAGADAPAGAEVTRSAVLMAVRFTEMTLDQVTPAFERALCSVATARISAVLTAGGAAPVPLGCTVTTRSGSVIAEATVVMPESATAAAIAVAVADIASNAGADIAGDAVLGLLGAFDAPTAAAMSVTVVPVDIAPVVADDVSLAPPAGLLARREGAPVTLEVTFTQTASNGVVSTVNVTGFAADDVEASAQPRTGGALPMVAEVAQLSPARYRLRVQPQAAAWPQEALQSCEDWTVSVRVAAGAAVGAQGDVSRASATAQLLWRPALDTVCDAEGDSDGGLNVRCLPLYHPNLCGWIDLL